MREPLHPGQPHIAELGVGAKLQEAYPVRKYFIRAIAIPKWNIAIPHEGSELPKLEMCEQGHFRRHSWGIPRLGVIHASPFNLEVVRKEGL